MNELEIESLLFKQVEKPKHFHAIKIINVFQNRYRINIYTETEEDSLMKKKITASYFCHYNSGRLEIIPDIDKKEETKSKSSKPIS